MWGGKEDVPWLSMTDDYGDIIQGLFLEPEKWNGHVVHGVSDIRSFSELVGAFQQGMCRNSYLADAQERDGK